MKNKITEILKRHGAIIMFGERAVYGSFPYSSRVPLRKAKAEIENLKDENGRGVRKCFVSDFNKLGLGAVRVCIVHF